MGLKQKKVPTTAAVRANAGITMAYYDRLRALIEEMQADVLATIEPTYANNPPEMAQDAIPADALVGAMKRLRDRWLARFDKLSHAMAAHFAQAVADRSDDALKAALRKGGFTVRFQPSRAQADIMAATVSQNVALIKSIPAQHLDEVEGLVMRSVQAGRDLSIVARGLQARLGVTKRRAALIARNQNDMATAQLHRVRQMELGLQAMWLHSHAGEVPRPTHVAMNGKIYDPAKGMYDPDPQVRRFIWPGELINCRCASRSVLPSQTN